MSRRNRPDRKARTAGTKQRPFARVRNRYPPMEILSADQVEAIHRASLKILRDMGLRVDCRTSLRLLKGAGADVDFDTRQVRFAPELVKELIAGAPSKFEVHARNPEKSIVIGGDELVFATTCGPPFVSDIDFGRRDGTLEDMRNFVKLVGALNVFHVEGGSGLEPMDLPPETRHLDMMMAQITLTDKAWAPNWLNSTSRARDCIEMAKIALQTDDDGLRARPGIIGGVNTNSPRLLDESQAEGLVEFARAGQPIYVAPFTLAGAMSPATVAGAVVLQNAEALAGIILGQAACRGAPVFYGSFAITVDMKTGSPSFGTPEYAQAVIMSGQMARLYGLPIRSSVTTSSSCVDAQATYESSLSIEACVQGHVNLIKHAGWLEGGLTCSFEKLILDAEMLQMHAAFLEEVDVTDDAFGLDAIAEVGVGGHFFGTQHTLDRYEDAFYAPLLSDWRNYENWRDDGSKTATQRANEIWKQLLREYEKPPIDPGVEEELEAYIAKRKEEIRSSASSN
ncbi:MAG: trimethylamine methyltransferase family protein [Rhodobacteraceae bacterium]|nr:trimethylamine methyltransferase family protein [Paracoccaceae bacterium]